MKNNVNDSLISLADKNSIQKEYEKCSEARHLVVNEIKEQIDNILTALDSNPVVNCRIKNFPSYFNKYIRSLRDGVKNPVITDLLGIRIICPFIEDLAATEDLIKINFNVVERDVKGHYSFKEFGYESTHLLITIPKAIINKHGYPGTKTIEIQIRTILQDAWAEVEHELVYKVEFSPFDEPMKRKLAAVNASLSLADIIFQEIRSYQRNYSKQIGKRRESFFQKIEESIDDLLFMEDHNLNSNLKDNTARANTSIKDEYDNDFNIIDNSNIDDLLVNALSAHNQNRFNDAISQYTKILDMKKPTITDYLKSGEDSRSDDMIRAIIYKHRGMAYFACSQYNDAISDFTSSLELDSQSYKAAYYRGVVHSVIKQYSRAIDDYTLSLSLNPYQPFCLFRRGQAYYHMGDYPQGLSDCENSLSLEPNNKSAVKFKKILHEKLRMF
ncbi:MAG: tetratricopeptide repeat protein [Treponema sp.]|nr:tetratricopeptide repeat protein [Treponema sp.]